MSTDRGPTPDGRLRFRLQLVGAVLLAATAVVHLHLYLTGYNTIPTIGPLFLFQVIVAFLLAVVVAIFGGSSRLIALLGAGFAFATLGGYLLTVWVGLFGFREVRTTAGIVAGIVEVAAFGVLLTLAVLPPTGAKSVTERFDAVIGKMAGRLPGGTRGSTGVVGAVSLVALIVLLATVATAGGTTTPVSSGGSNVLKSTPIGGVTVLTNAQGFTLYWFAPDTPTKSACDSSCAAYWPPVKGPAKLASGVGGTLTTITRSDGTKQAAYDGHPLYTYIQDTKPGQNTGNNVTLNGGKWFEVKVSH